MTITDICEKENNTQTRYPGEPVIMVVTLEDDFGREIEIEVADTWLSMQELSVGDEWPEELEEQTEAFENISKQAEWMASYMEALEDLDEE